jgi:hypothetical protein
MRGEGAEVKRSGGTAGLAVSMFHVEQNAPIQRLRPLAVV